MSVNTKHINKSVVTISTIIGIVAWVLFLFHKNISSHDYFYTDKENIFSVMAMYSIKLSFLLSIINLFISAYSLLKWKFSWQIVTNFLMSFLLSSFFIFMFILAKITGGA